MYSVADAEQHGQQEQVAVRWSLMRLHCEMGNLDVDLSDQGLMLGFAYASQMLHGNPLGLTLARCVDELLQHQQADS